MAEHSAIDLDALRRLLRAMGGEMDDLKDLFDSFVEDTPPLFVTMRTAAENADWEAFRRAAHTAKGAARDFGASDMAKICAALEHEAATGPVADAFQRVADVEAAFAAACGALKSLLNGGGLA
ncbi:Hpt domain-containing protein [Defluviimonas sp. D31]|uniref:Hpt domain-containing protein n=1 Tax=Defluviimonas sp. D31 TaxID=3083253 RepID=UPI00296EA340|nr:Hpt domain-containing protein [Defluviimonas sp. D31]MDW4551671.1 Hpt domain-containing protein [Defluviimonas sp. D31]